MPLGSRPTTKLFGPHGNTHPPSGIPGQARGSSQNCTQESPCGTLLAEGIGGVGSRPGGPVHVSSPFQTGVPEMSWAGVTLWWATRPIPAHRSNAWTHPTARGTMVLSGLHRPHSFLGPCTPSIPGSATPSSFWGWPPLDTPFGGFWPSASIRSSCRTWPVLSL